MYTPKCNYCNRKKEELLRIAVEIKDKKTRETKLVSYTEPICFECIDQHFKSKRRMRIYV